MGLDMKRLVAALLGLAVAACVKEPDFKQDFGPEVSAQAVDRAIRDAETPSPYEIRAGEFSYMERTTKLENYPPAVVFQSADTVLSKETDPDDPRYWKFRIVAEIVELIEGQMVSSSKEYTPRLLKEGEPNVASMAWEPVRTRALDAAAEKVTYHRLKREASLFPVPVLVQRRSDCGRLEDAICRGGLPVTRLSFDKVIWEDGVGTKTSFLFVFSAAAPYFSSQLLGCAQTTVPYEGQRINVTQCEEVRDFTFGPPTP